MLVFTLIHSRIVTEEHNLKACTLFCSISLHSLYFFSLPTVCSSSSLSFYLLSLTLLSASVPFVRVCYFVFSLYES